MNFVVEILGDEFEIVSTPTFPDSISEGDVRWDKGMSIYTLFLDDYILYY